MTRIIFFLAFTFACLHLSGEESILKQTYKFHQLSIHDGLTNNTVNAMLVDSKGYLWVATAVGLNRYDGYDVVRFNNFNGDRTKPILNIEKIQEDALGNIWIENTDMLARYNRYTNRFDIEITDYLNSLGFKLKKGKAVRVKTVSDGGLWVITENKISYLNVKKNKGIKTWNVNISPCPYFEEYHGELFLTDASNLWHFSSETGKVENMSLPKAFKHDKGHLRIYTDNDGLIWVFSMVSEHICYFPSSDVQQQTMFHLPENTHSDMAHSKSNAIRAIFDDTRGKIWIATDHNGIFVFDRFETEFRNLRHSEKDESSISSDNVACLTTDQHGTIWVGHYNTGISYYNENYNMFSHRPIANSDISTMMFDSKGNLWLGTDGNGLYIEHPDGTVVPTQLPKITISSLLEDKNGNVWAGTYNNGLYKMNGQKVEEEYTVENGTLTSNSVWQMATDRKGNIWYSSVFQPLSLFNPSTKTGRLFFSENGDSINATSVISDSEGNIFSGTYYGLWKYSSVEGTGKMMHGNERGTQQFLQQYIGPMFMDNERKQLWMGHKTGITVWEVETDSLYFLDRSSGLLDTDIRGIEKDHNGIFWISSATGISSVFITKGEDKSVSFKVRKFTKREGVETEYFNTFAFTRNLREEVFFGGKNGYTHILPARISSSDATKKPSFGDISIGDSIVTLPEGEEWGKQSLHLSYSDHLIEVKFFPGNLLSANRVLYAYRLIGLNDEWVYTTENSVKLFSLAHGTYTLEVKVAGETGEWSEVNSLTIYVAPPFYLSWWMICIYVILLAAIILLISRKVHNKHEKRIIEQRTNIEQEQMVQMSEMKLRFFTNISHDLRTPLTLITSPLQTLLSEESLPEDVKKRLSLINKNVQILLSQVNKLLDFRRLDVGGESFNPQSAELVQIIRDSTMLFTDYARDKHITLEYLPHRERIYANIDAEKIKKVVYNLLSNAMKFTPPEGKVTVTVNDEEGKILITVADTGTGISNHEKQKIFQRFYQVHNDKNASGSGIGLHIVSEYVRMHNGTVSVSDNSPSGAVFTVSIPVGNISEKAPQQKVEKVFDYSESADEGSKEAENAFNILVVDDNRDLCSFISDSLEGEYGVYCAEDGEQALVQLSRHNISLVISDVMMPNMNGLELCKRIKTTLKWSHIPVILLTARSAEASLIEGLQHGADDYITKPFNIDHLKLRIQKFAEWAATNHKTFNQKIDVEPSEITITPLDEEFVARALKLVENHIAEADYSVEQLGRDMGMSRTNLYKKLIFITGKGPHDFIRTIRLKRAYRLLQKSQMQVSEIAYAVGYNSPKRFTENFKAEYGMTPTEFVKSNKDE